MKKTGINQSSKWEYKVHSVIEEQHLPEGSSSEEINDDYENCDMSEDILIESQTAKLILEPKKLLTYVHAKYSTRVANNPKCMLQPANRKQISYLSKKLSDSTPSMLELDLAIDIRTKTKKVSSYDSKGSLAGIPSEI